MQFLTLLATPLGRGAVIAGSILIAWLSLKGGIKVHDMKVESRVIEKSKSEAHKDVAIGKEAQSRSLAASDGVRSKYRRD